MNRHSKGIYIVIGSMLLLSLVGQLSDETPHTIIFPVQQTPIPIVAGKARWDCPTPIPPLPTVDSTSVLPITDALSLPTATPYYRGDFFFLGQDAYSSGMRLTVHSVESKSAITVTQSIQVIDVEIAVTQAMPVDFMQQLVVREVRTGDGRGSRGFWRSDLTTQAPYATLPTYLTAGQEWRGRIAVATPRGTASTVYIYRTLTDAVITDSTTDGVLVFNTTGRDPFCTDNIARQPMNPIGGIPQGTPGTINGTPVPIPPGTNALVAFAVAHLGYPYVWGAKGDSAFDCSGLVYAAYRSIGIDIPMGTRGGPAPGQGYYGTPLSVNELRPGDALFFATVAGPEQPSHAGLYVGDLNGNGTGDMIHALWYDTGVIFTDNVFGNRYYASAFWGARRMPGFPY